jgi:hypothetical protein
MVWCLLTECAQLHDRRALHITPRLPPRTRPRHCGHRRSRQPQGDRRGPRPHHYAHTQPGTHGRPRSNTARRAEHADQHDRPSGSGRRSPRPIPPPQVRRWGGEADAHPRAPAGCDPDEQEPETRPDCWLLDGLGHTTQVVSPQMARSALAGGAGDGQGDRFGPIRAIRRRSDPDSSDPPGF